MREEQREFQKQMQEVKKQRELELKRQTENPLEEIKVQKESNTNDELNNVFINHIKLRKTVSLDDLANKFKINSTEVAERLTQLEQKGKINGFVDSKNKYVYLTDKETNSLLRSLMNKGIVSKEDLTNEYNRISKGTPAEEVVETEIKA